MVDFQLFSTKIANHVLVDLLNKFMIDVYLFMPLGLKHVISISLVKNNLNLQ
jgi:hypothetical protein